MQSNMAAVRMFWQRHLMDRRGQEYEIVSGHVLWTYLRIRYCLYVNSYMATAQSF
jgi:hypothetical protein